MSQGLQLISIACKCCGEELLVPWGVMKAGKIVEKVAVGIQIPWKVCPNCDYDLGNVRFRAPDIEVRHQSSHPGLRGLKT